MSNNQNISNAAFLREVRMGLAAVVVTISLLCYVVYVRMSGGNFNWLTGRETTFVVPDELDHSDHPQVKPGTLAQGSSDHATTVLPDKPGASANELTSADERAVDPSVLQNTIEAPSLPRTLSSQDSQPPSTSPSTNQAGTKKPSLILGGLRMLAGVGQSQPNDADSNDVNQFKPITSRQKDDNQLKLATAFEVKPAGHQSIENEFGNGSEQLVIPETMNALTQGSEHPQTKNEFDSHPQTSGAQVRAQQLRVIVAEIDDNFWAIAQREYGDGRFFRALALENKDSVDPSGKIVSGANIKIPTKSQLITKWPDACKALQESIELAENSAGNEVLQNVYVTKAGDTLFEISRDHLDQAYRYAEIIKLNEQVLPTNVAPATALPAGIKLVLPDLQ
jgi:nucleoid-associated protein YgaU